MFFSKKLLKNPNITHCFFSNRNGVSKNIYKSLNCGLGSKDKKLNIIKNLHIVSKKIGTKYKNLIIMKQTHSNKILFFGKNEKITHTALSSGGSNFLHSRGWVKEESLDKFRDNFNEECFQIFKFSVSVEHLMIS